MSAEARRPTSRRATGRHPLHDPAERVLVGSHGPWKLYAFAVNDPRHGYFARKGMLHLQLWSEEHEVSVLTPSALTAGRFEVRTPEGRFRMCCLRGVRAHLTDQQLPVPCTRWIARNLSWLVVPTRFAAASLRAPAA